MTSLLIELGIDAIDQKVMAPFWAEALGWKMDVDSDGDVELIPQDGTPFIIFFEPTDKSKQGQNRTHFDITTTSIEDQNETVEKLLTLGGRHIDIGQSPDETHVVLADPEGNELCILAPGNNFLKGAPRLGAINCDGSRETGVFWSEVLGWPLVWDQDGETAIREPGGTGPLITWSGLPLKPKLEKNRIHIDVASTIEGEQMKEVERLISLGARHVDIGQGSNVSWVVLADPDDNEFCVLRSGL